MIRSDKQISAIDDQTTAEKMYLLKTVAQQILGPKWRFFNKIRRTGENLLQGKTGYSDSLKATRSALRYTAKTAKSAYALAYQASVKDICASTDKKKEDFTGLKTLKVAKNIPTLSDQQDADIISWTPIKFLLPIKRIQEKGLATKRHTEGLAAKLIFKVVAFYAIPENWELNKLTFYLQNLSANSTNNEVHEALNPLKEDLQSFLAVFDTLKFKQSGLKEERSRIESALDINLGIGTTEYQIRILYWYDFIYEAMELFVFRYFLVLVTASPCAFAIRQLAKLMEPVLDKVIENRSLFLCAFETDDAKSQLRKSFEQFKQKMMHHTSVRTIKTSKGEFETYFYNSHLLESMTLQFDIQNKPDIKSEWGSFIKYNLLGMKQKNEDEVDESSIDGESSEIMAQAVMQILSTIAKANQFKRSARQQILDEFKEHLTKEVLTTQFKIKENKNKANIQINHMESEFLRLKLTGDKKAAAIRKKADSLQSQMEKQGNALKVKTKVRLNAQKERLKKLFSGLSHLYAVHAGVAANIVFKLTQEIDTSGEFSKEFIRFIINNIQTDYSTHLTPFYENAFEIMKPSVHEKVAIIQSLKKSGVAEAFGLGLSKEENEQFQKLISSIRLKIAKAHPNVFNSSVLFFNELLPMDLLLKMSIDNNSLNILLRMKVVTQKQPMAHYLRPAAIKLIQFLNTIEHAVPANTLILAGKENTKDPQDAINSVLLKALIKDYETSIK
ncbi:MAG: hypothetical protein HOE30_07570 [Deltaproteobacteria bacterium]|nr:hypothetical protein [Deltaproteobacteria bacterium]MBT6498595.1 hypothetical protein [Deltaproteobacteria bacterium]